MAIENNQVIKVTNSNGLTVRDLRQLVESIKDWGENIPVTANSYSIQTQRSTRGL